MKAICVSCFDYYDTRMHGIIEYLKDCGYEVDYLITDFNHFSKERYSTTHGNATQIHVPMYSKNISPQRILSHIIFSNKVIRIIKEKRPDIIYCIIPPNTLVKKISKYRQKHENCRVIYDVYDLWPESFPYKSKNIIVNLFFKQWANRRDNYISVADVLLSVSEKTKETLDNKYGMNSKVMRPSIAVGSIPQYTFDIDNEISFCYVGHVNHITDIELGTALLGGLSKNKNVTLHIIGEGQNKDKWIHMLNEVGVKVISHGVVFDDEEKKAIFGLCNMGLNIPRPEIESSMSLKSIEYMRNGLPYINSGIGDNEFIVRTRNIGVNVNNSNIKETIEVLLRMSNDELKKMHYCCVDYYNSEFANPNYEDIFSSLVTR